MKVPLPIAVAILQIFLLKSIATMSISGSESTYQPNYIASIQKISNYGENADKLCSGVIIGPFHVITTAHCIFGLENDQLLVRINLWEPNRDEYLYKVVNSTHHPTYDNSSGSPQWNDVAVLEVDRNFHNSPDVSVNSYRYDSTLKYTNDTCKITTTADNTVVKRQNCTSSRENSGLKWTRDAGSPLVDEFDHLIGIFIEEKGDSDKRTTWFIRIVTVWKFIEKILNDKDVNPTCDTDNHLPRHIVSIEKNLNDGSGSKRICTGAIINKFYIITVAHCVYGYNSSQLSVHTERMYTKLCNYMVTYDNVKKIILHPDYTNSNGISHLNDIAILKTSSGFELDDNIKLISYRPEYDIPIVNNSRVLYPYFYEYDDSYVMFYGNAMALEDCRSKVTYEVTESHICTYPEDTNYKTFDKDGGPLINAYGYFIGIYIDLQDNSTLFPRLFTRIASHLKFIDDVLNTE